MRNSIFNLSNELVKNEIISLKTIKKVQSKYLDDPDITIEDALDRKSVV